MSWKFGQQDGTNYGIPMKIYAGWLNGSAGAPDRVSWFEAPSGSRKSATRNDAWSVDLIMQKNGGRSALPSRWMSFGFRLLALSAVTLPFAACGAYDPNAGGDAEGTAESLQEAQTGLIDIKLVNSSAVGESKVTCPSGYPRVFGTAHGIVTGALKSGGFSTTGPEPTGAVTRPHDPSSKTTATAVCGPDVNQAPQGKIDSDGDATVSCPAGMVAAGGGGFCSDPAAKLIRSRPSPDQPGSVPTGWRATCSTGSVSATVNCWKPQDHDAQCRTVRRDTENNYAGVVTCASGDEYMIAAGAYCGDGTAIRTTFITDGMQIMLVNCTGTTDVHAYGICCDGLQPG